MRAVFICMNMISELWRRFLFLLRREQFDRELEEEMRFHLEMKAAENRERGMEAKEADYAAQRQFGNQTLLREVSRAMWGFNSLEILWQDVRYGTKTLVKNPGSTIIALMALALGVGANTAIFSVVNGVILRPLPFNHSERLVFVTGYREGVPEVEGGTLSPARILPCIQPDPLTHFVGRRLPWPA